MFTASLALRVTNGSLSSSSSSSSSNDIVVAFFSSSIFFSTSFSTAWSTTTTFSTTLFFFFFFSFDSSSSRFFSRRRRVSTFAFAFELHFEVHFFSFLSSSFFLVEFSGDESAAGFLVARSWRRKSFVLFLRSAKTRSCRARGATELLQSLSVEP